MNLPLFESNKRKDNVVRCQCHNWHIGFEITDPMCLGESLRNQFCLESYSISVLDFENPLATDEILTGWQFNQFPCAILHQGFICYIDCQFPFLSVNKMINDVLIIMWLVFVL